MATVQTTNGPPPGEQIRPRLRRCKICTLPPPCSHLSLQTAKQLLLDELSTYPLNQTASICPSYYRSGSCTSMNKRNGCTFRHPPITSPLVVLGTDYSSITNRQCVPNNLKTKIDAKHADPKSRCILCKLNMQCKTHFSLSKYDQLNLAKRPNAVNDPLPSPEPPPQRCPLCTLILPCSHFTNASELQLKRHQEKEYTKRYPIKATYGQPNCMHWVQTGSCAMYDNLGICKFWHPQIYANKRFHLDDPVITIEEATSTADIASCRSESSAFHGIDGLPGEHQSSHGSMKVGKTRLAIETYKQDLVNLEAARERCYYPMNSKTKKPNKKQWSFPSPGLFRRGLKIKEQKSGLNRLRVQKKRTFKKYKKNKKKTDGDTEGTGTSESKTGANKESTENKKIKECKVAKTDEEIERRLENEKKLSRLRRELQRIYWHGTK